MQTALFIFLGVISCIIAWFIAPHESFEDLLEFFKIAILCMVLFSCILLGVLKATGLDENK